MVISDCSINKIPIINSVIEDMNDDLQNFFISVSIFSSYSVLSASTGSFFAAILAGINPPMIVSSTLIAISIIA